MVTIPWGKPSLISFLGVLGVMASQAYSVTVDRFWNEALDADFVVAANWQGNIAPDTDDNAIFDLGRTTVSRASVIFNSSSVTTRYLEVHNDDLVFLGADYSVSDVMVVGSDASDVGALELGDSNSSYPSDLDVTNRFYIGDGVGSQGKVIVNNGSSLTTSSTYVGYEGVGELEVISGIFQPHSLHIASESTSSGTVTVKDSGSISAEHMNLGSRGPGVLNIESNSSVTVNDLAFMGYISGGHGTVNVGGAGAILDIVDTLEMGKYGGTGTVNINLGGLVNVGDELIIESASQINVNGGKLSVANLRPLAGSTFNWNSGTLDFTVGLPILSNGPLGDTVIVPSGKFLEGKSFTVGLDSLLHITAGGKATTLLSTLVTGSIAQPATVLVDGVGAELNSSLIVGNTTDGFVEVINGGKIVSGQILLSQNVGFGSLRVDGAGSEVIGGAAELGRISGSQGLLEIVNGGVFNSSGLVQVGISGGDGIITIDGPGSSAQVVGSFSGLFIGHSGTGQLTVSNGGSLEADNGQIGASGTSGQALVTGLASLVLVNNSLAIGPIASSPGTAGILTIADSASVSVGDTLDINDGGSLVLSKGSISTVVLDMASGASFAVEVGGLVAGTGFGKIDVSGSVTLAGSAEISFIDSFLPATGDAYEVISGASIIGVFGTESIIAPSGYFSFTSGFTYSATSVTVNITQATLMGDLDADGFVGINDLNLVLSNWNQNVTAGNRLQGDPSGDGFVGISDLNTVLGQWNLGRTPPPVSGALVPEPTSAMLLLVGGYVLTRYRSR